jgi:hypothetical protein
MPKDGEPPEPWTPDKPLEDEDEEAEVQAKVRAKQRFDFLLNPPAKKGEKKKYKLFD